MYFNVNPVFNYGLQPAVVTRYVDRHTSVSIPRTENNGQTFAPLSRDTFVFHFYTHVQHDSRAQFTDEVRVTCPECFSFRWAVAGGRIDFDGSDFISSIVERNTTLRVPIRRAGLANIGAVCEIFLRGLFSGCSGITRWPRRRSIDRPIDQSKSLDKYMNHEHDSF